MSSALALPLTSETKWTVISGPMSGSVRLMNSASFFIGRSPECEFVIVSDPKCSRKHARIESGPQGCEVESLTEKNFVLVNGKEISKALLHDGDVLTIGDTKVQFNLTSLPTVRSIQRPAKKEAKRNSAPRSQKKKAPGKVVFYIVLGLVLMFIFVGNSKKKKLELGLRTEQQIQADIETANKLEEAAQNTPVKKLDQTITSRQAQENFVRGFRDYRKGQYERSLDSFQACLALDPSHVLCTRYIRLAQRRFNELVQYGIVMGRKYRDQNQFKSCRSAFRNVMVMVKDANSAPYKEAKANYDACNALVEGRF